jgi:hypothetical protein
MSSRSACSTLFFAVNSLDPVELAARYEALADPANGYLTQLNCAYVFVDAQASETADWSRQIELAGLMATEDALALSIFMAGDLWALALTRAGHPATVAAYTPDNPKTFELLPHKLLALERQLGELFPAQLDVPGVDALFGAILDGAMSAEEGVTALLDMLGCSPDWLRWSWYETIPDQLFLDPDLSPRVTPLGEARNFWEE